MSKPKIKDIRRGYVLDILLRVSPSFKEGLPQKEITKTVIEEIYRPTELKRDPIKTKYRGKELEDKVYRAVSKTITSLEQDEIINISPLRISGKQGANQNIIKLNETPEALYGILKSFDESLFGGGLEGRRFKFTFIYNLLVSEYYKKLVNIKFVNKLTSLSELPFNEKDKKLIYYLIKSSPDAIKILFDEAYINKRDFKIYTTSKNKKIREDFLNLEKNSQKRRFINSIQVDFVKSVFEYYNMPGLKGEVEAQINVRFKDKEGNLIYSFSNYSEVELEEDHILYSDFIFI